MSDQPYNLLDEAWICVVDSAGAARRVSLLGAFREAHEICDIRGDIATQDVALLRLLLAVLRRSVREAAAESDSLTQYWHSLHSSPTLPLGLIEPYLEQYRDRFDLKHPEAPFMQVAGDSTSKRSGLQKLIADLPDTPDKQLFSTRAGHGAESLSLAEASRWLVHAHAFDPSGIKTGLVGDSRAKGGRGYPIGLGWSGNCGIITAEGSTLKETLLLNLVLLDDVSEADAPPWELAQDGPDARMERPGVPATPKGPTQAMTWQTRRVVLHLDESGDRVIDVSLGNGDPVSPINRWDIEDHTAWRYSTVQSKVGRDVFFPLGIDSDRELWRGLSGILAVEPTRGRVNSKPPPRHAAGVVTWVDALVREEALDAATIVPLRVTGAVYGTQNSVTENIRSSVIDLPASVWADRRLALTAVNAVSDAEAAVVALRGLAKDICLAAGLESGGGSADDASAQAYASLQPLFHAWVRRLEPGSDVLAVEAAWQRAVRREVNTVAQSLAHNAGTAAIIGRTVEVLGKPRYLDIGSAWGRFQASLRRALPLAAPQPSPTAPIEGSDHA